MSGKFVWYWLPVLLWVSGIYLLSAQSGLRVSAVNWQDFYLRKLAHIFEYFVLCFLVFRGFHYGSGLNRPKSLILAFIFALIYAVTDELHQSFVSDRQGRVRDILIDSLGIFSAVWLLAAGKLKRFEQLAPMS